MASAQVFIGSVAPLAYQTLYAATVHWIHGAFTFYVTAGLSACGLLLTYALEVEVSQAQAPERKRLLG